MKTGVELIAEERQRQVEGEGWTPEHDNQHKFFELARAGGSYTLNIAGRMITDISLADYGRSFWPWGVRYWKPTPEDPVRQLVKAGALIAAEIDRLQRQI